MNLTSGQARALTSWTDMIQRCCDPDDRFYRSNGGAGVGIATVWLDPWYFLRDMGERPESQILGRIDPGADFGPGNCVWLSAADKNRKTRRNVYIGALNQSQVADETGLAESTILRRRKAGRAVHDPRYFKRAKLNSDEVVEIKRLLQAGNTDLAAGRAFGVSRTAIRNIRTGKAWSDVCASTHAVKSPGGGLTHLNQIERPDQLYWE